MRTRRGWGLGAVAGCALVAAAAVAAGCGSVESGNGGNGSGGKRMSDAAGDLVLPDRVVKIAEVDRSKQETEGKVRYRVENVSRAEQPDLVWSVTFHFPPNLNAAIAMPEVTETSAENPLKLVADESSEWLEATCPGFDKYRAANQPLLGTTFNLQVEELVETTPRSQDGTLPGTLFLQGRVECVGMSGDLYGQKTLWIEFENVSNAKLTPFEVQAVFTGPSGGRTPSRACPGLEPKQRARVELDLEGIDTGNSAFSVKVRFRRK